tara:strand:+ start:258 stop:458 length:201 start_codon:yes stop_codon:yes gene_type:complete
MNKKIRFSLTQDEVEYLADLLRYEMADPEPRMEMHLEPEQVSDLQKRLRKKSIDNADQIERLFQSA